MSNTDHTKSGGKSGQRKRKRDQQGSRKPNQPQSLRPDQMQDSDELSEAAVASTDTSSIGAAEPADTSPIGQTASAETSPISEATAADTAPIGEATTAETSPIGAAASADTSPIGLQTIATAYRDYTRKSFADAQSFVEKLSGARSLDKAFEAQTEFAKQAYETFMADSWRIRALYGELVRQTLKPPTGPQDR
jgi:cytoskeletal protein RodZ